MKYLIIESENNILHLYLGRVYGALRIGNRNHIPLEVIKDIDKFVSLCRGIVDSGDSLSIKKAKVPYLEKLSTIEYAKLLFKK